MRVLKNRRGDVMNQEKMTKNTIASINEASQIAMEYGNQAIDCEHILLAMLGIENSLVKSVINRMNLKGKSYP